jgi:hypothetical protein
MAYVPWSCSLPRVVLTLVLFAPFLLFSCASVAGPGSSTPPRASDRGEAIEVRGIVLSDVFPALYQSYNKHPLGTVTLANGLSTRVQDITLSFFLRRYMDAPTPCPGPKELLPGESKTADLFALFNAQLLGLTETTRAAAEIIVQYRIAGQSYALTTPTTLILRDRNTIMGDDVRRLAAFTPSNDAAITSLARNVLASIGDHRPAQVDAKLFSALGLFSALDILGVTFVSGPEPIAAQSGNAQVKLAVVQFPRQTLEYKAGDYADLSLLYSALLESVGVETALLPLSGRLCIAFCLDASPDEARRMYTVPDNLVFRGDRTWAPVDVARIHDGFVLAWESGAKEWRESMAKGEAGIFPVREAWQIYEPVQLPGEMQITLPGKDEILNAVESQVELLVDRELVH